MNQKYIFKTKQILLTLVITAAALSGCKKFLDVNDNPNNPDKAAPELLLPASQAATGQIIGNFFQIYGNMWAQYWTQNPTSSQYRAIDQYNPAATAFDRSWLILYRNALINADLIIKKPEANLEFMKGIAYLMKAYTFQVTTDAFGDIPIKEALQPDLFRAPHFDSQEVVYDSIFHYIDRGMELLEVTSGTSPSNQDIVFQGNKDNWIAFANTLKLKAYLRLAYVDAARAQAGIEELYDTNPTFLTVDASIKYLSTGGNENPLYNEMKGLGSTQNIVASTTAVSAYEANNDPRVNRFYDIFPTDTPESNHLKSIAQGTYNLGKHTGKLVSPPSPLVGGRPSNTASATAPVKFFSIAESYFLQAEAAVRGWGLLPSAAVGLYKDGVRKSFVSVGLTEGAADAYMGTVNTVDLEDIITQKYYAMNGFQGFEAWTEYRRTGFPSFLVKSAASTIGADRLPARMIYPSSEATSNINFPGLVTIYTPVWWDVAVNVPAVPEPEEEAAE